MCLLLWGVHSNACSKRVATIGALPIALYMFMHCSNITGDLHNTLSDFIIIRLKKTTLQAAMIVHLFLCLLWT